jgi:hypothetical protein
LIILIILGEEYKQTVKLGQDSIPRDPEIIPLCTGLSSPRYPDRLWGQPASHPVRTGGFSPAVKRPGRETDHSPSASTEVKKMWICTSTPPYFFTA